MDPRKLLLCTLMATGFALAAQAEDAAVAADAAPVAIEEAAVEASQSSALDAAVEPAIEGDAASSPPASLSDDEVAIAAEAVDSEATVEAVEAIEAAEAALAPMASQPGADVSVESTDAASGGEEMPAEETAMDENAAPALGAVAWDSQGREGRIHVVKTGDTLWHISSAYLGTPWVWPSIWNDNGDIENPHLIHPGDRIWISEFEMRRISADEADAMMANGPVEPELAAVPAAASDGEPAPMAPQPAPMMDAVEDLGSLRVAGRESVGLISPERMDASSSIVGRIPARTLLSQEDEVYVGLGESEVEQGDQFTIFRTHEKVFDPDTGELLGYHVEIVGWLEIDETHPESSLATIRMSNADIELADRLTPREPLPAEIPMQPSPAGVEGKISFFPQRRVLMGLHDFVYLNRGLLDGIEIGSPLEVYREGYMANDSSRHLDVQVPDRVVARMVVVRADEEASVALVTNADIELEKGDRFRGAN